MYHKFLLPNVFLISLVLCISARAQGPWTTKTDMPTARNSLSSATVNGKIYVMGGELTGANWDGPATNKLEVYDPANDSWEAKSPMSGGRNSFSCNAVNGKIYVLGGQSQIGTVNLSSVEEYDPVNDSWTVKTSMPDVRAGLSSCVVDGKIYVIGGWKYDTPGPYYHFREVWEYDPATDTWDTNKALMPTGREYLTSSVVNRKIYVFGGWDESVVFKTVEMYDPAKDTWTTLADMPEKRVYLKSGALNNLIYIFGGSTHYSVAPYSDTWEYNPATDSIKAVSAMPMGVMQPAVSEENGKIYIIGGTTLAINFPIQTSSKVFEYNPLIDAIEKQDNDLPNMFSLKQNYPNPFNPITNIEFQIRKNEFVTLKIYNLLGQAVAILVSDKLNVGNYNYSWDAGSLASGVYLYKFQAGDYVETKKMVLLR